MGISEMKTKWADIREVMVKRIDPPVYSHPQMVYEMACDLDMLMKDPPVTGRAYPRVETIAELDGLPVGVLVLEIESENEKYAFPWVKVIADSGQAMWSAPGDTEDYAASEVGLPVYVVWAPPSE